MLEVIQAGWGNTLQDEGRLGGRQWGLGSAGPLDVWHFSHANLLVGNQERKNAIEIRQGPMRFIAHQPTLLSVCGYGYDVFVENTETGAQHRHYLNFQLEIHEGEHLWVQPNAPSGTAYLAVSSGFIGGRWQAGDAAGEKILGSLSTDLTARLGRSLKKGDQLDWYNEATPLDRSVRRPTRHPDPLTAHPAGLGIRPYEITPMVRAMEGPEHAMIPAQIRAHFWQTPWIIPSPPSRMAARLAHTTPMDTTATPIDWPKPLSQLPSHAVFPGTVQLPSPNKPIVLMAESQVTGGYPRIASVIQADLWKLAHLPLNTPIYWQKCSTEEAMNAWEKKINMLGRMKNRFSFLSEN